MLSSLFVATTWIPRHALAQSALVSHPTSIGNAMAMISEVRRGCAFEDAYCEVKAGHPVRHDPQSRQAPFWGQYWNFDWHNFCVWPAFVNSTSVVLDVGGWIGLTAIWFSQRARKGRVVVLEPGQLAFDDLMLNIAANPDSQSRISAVRSALGGRTGRQRISNNGDAMDRLVEDHEVVGEPVDATWVTVMTMSDLVAQFPQLQDVSFIKVDTEGYERVIIPALTAFLRQVKPVMHVSVHPMFMDPSDTDAVLQALLDICPFFHRIDMVGKYSKINCGKIRLHAMHGDPSAKVLRQAEPTDFLCTWYPDQSGGIRRSVATWSLWNADWKRRGVEMYERDSVVGMYAAASGW